MWKSDSPVKTDQLAEIVQDYFGNFEAALGGYKGIQYAWLANLLCCEKLSRNGCYNATYKKPTDPWWRSGYSLYHYLMSGAFSTYDKSVFCDGEEIFTIRFKMLFSRDIDIKKQENKLQVGHLKFDPIPVESLAFVNPPKLIVSPLKRWTIPAELRWSFPAELRWS